MKRWPFWLAGLALAVTLGLWAPKSDANTSISVDLRVGDPYRGPELVFRDEPDVVVIPGSRVYYIRDYDYDIYRYGSYWYYYYGGDWYRARRYGGPYRYISFSTVPRTVTVVPARYRRHWNDPPGHAYGHYKDRPDRRHEVREIRREERREVRRDDRRDDRREERGHKRGRW